MPLLGLPSEWAHRHWGLALRHQISGTSLRKSTGIYCDLFVVAVGLLLLAKCIAFSSVPLVMLRGRVGHLQ